MLLATTLPLDSVKMEDRKRPAPDDLTTGRLKRQAVEVNGPPIKAEEDMARDDDLDRFTKDAVLRQMKEYKREKHTLEQQLAQITKRSAFHDEHLLIIDAWFLQLLDELSLLQLNNNTSDTVQLGFSSTLISSDLPKFQDHLGAKSEEMKAAVARLFAQTPTSSPDVKKLQERVSALLAAEKAHAVELQRAVSERALLDERLFNATTRYMTAEKQLDRTKSNQVAKLEAQAMALSRPDSAQKIRSEPDGGNGSPDRGLGTDALEALKKEAQAVSEKHKEQMEKLVADNKSLTDSVSAAQIKLQSLSDDDYAHTELFKHLKAQYSDVVKRINNLEARNAELQEEAKQLQRERTEYRDKVDNEFRDQDVLMQSEIAQKDADLTRVRAQRDELVAEAAVRRSALDAQKESHERLRELVEARQSRINALESEVERLHALELNRPQVQEEGDAALLTRIKTLETERSSFDQELRSMEVAFRKASSLASMKIGELLNQEDRMRLNGEEKAKADQKYFASRKLLDARDAQFKDMQKQVSRSSEIISTLKDTESSCRSLLVNVEKQLAEAKEALQHVTVQHRMSQQSSAEHKTTVDRLTSQVEGVTKLVSTKDESEQQAKKAQRAAEIRLEELKVEMSQMLKETDFWKSKASGTASSEDTNILKKLVYCTVCDRNIKDTVLKTCRHVMCKSCVENQIKSRERRCPICRSAYGATDFSPVIL